MKKILIFLSAICIFSISNAQTSKEELLNLLKSKHDYEKMFTGKTLDAAFKTKYIETYAKVDKDKRKIISYIDKALKDDSEALGKEIIFYVFESPISSNRNENNRMSLLIYFKIVKYSLENSESELPRLSEVPSNILK